MPRLLALYQYLTPEDEPLGLDEAAERLAAFHAMKDSGVFVGYLSDKPSDKLICSCALAVIPNLTRSGRPYGLVENVITHPDHRGAGYGGRILSHAVGHAWQHDCYKVMLLTGSKRPQTHAFYQRAGFEASKTGYQIRRIAPRPE